MGVSLELEEPGAVYTCRVHLPSPGLKLSLTPLPRPRVQTLALLPGLCCVCPCRCLGRMKPSCVTMGHLLTQGTGVLSGEVCWKPSPKREWKNSTLLAVHAPPASPGWVSGKTENFLVFIRFSFLCFQRQRGCSPQSPGNCPRRTEPSREE